MLVEVELANPAFSGPLALLLDLIEKRRLPITQVSLAEVADQYLERMRDLVGLDPDMLADFLVIAAKLILIKSRELLPVQPPETEEPDVAVDLEQRLLEYRIFRDAAEALRGLAEGDRHSYPRQPDAGPPPRPEPPLEPVPPEMLRAAMIRMLKALRAEGEPLALPPRASVEERIDFLLASLSTRTATFAELAGDTLDRIVATFLALLELLRRGRLVAEQEAPFAEIRLAMAPHEA